MPLHENFLFDVSLQKNTKHSNGLKNYYDGLFSVSASFGEHDNGESGIRFFAWTAFSVAYSQYFALCTAALSVTWTGSTNVRFTRS